MSRQEKESYLPTILILGKDSKRKPDRQTSAYDNSSNVDEGKEENCEQAFMEPRNKTLERYKFFARKQKDKETLRH